MKKIILYAIVSCLAFPLLAQHSDWAPIGAVWYYDESAGVGYPPNSGYYYHLVQKDTTFAGKNCRKIIRKVFRGNGVDEVLSPIYTYAVNDSVYYYNDIFNRFQLCMDFSAAVGDTLVFPVPDASSNDTIFRVVMDSIVPVITSSGDTLQHFYSHSIPVTDTSSLSSGDYSFAFGYLNRAGASWFMPPNPTVYIPEIDYTLRCYTEVSGLSYRPNTSVACDYRIVAVEKIPMLASFAIYPNPASRQIQISFSADLHSALDYKIYNLLGQNILSGQFSKSGETVSIQDFAIGIYILEARSEGKLLASRKFVKE